MTLVSEEAGTPGAGDARPAHQRLELSPERIFLALALCFGTAFAVVTPPFDMPDERRHLGRAYAISQGQLRVPGFAPGHGATLPADLFSLHPAAEGPRCQHSVSESRALLAQGRREGEMDAVRFSTPYAPLAYFPQSAAILVGRAMDLSAAWLLYLGRFANLGCWILLVHWALRIAPRRKWAWLALALTPMATFVAGSLTADAVMTALSLLFVALTLRAALPQPARGPLERSERLGLLLAAGGVALAKPGYWPLTALLLFIPSAHFGTGAQRARFFALLAALVLLPSALWIVLTQAAQPFSLGPEADPALQLQGMLNAPWRFAGIALQTLRVQWLPWVASFVGVLGEVDVALPLSLYALYPAVLVSLCTLDGPDPKWLNARRRLALLGLFLLCALAILAMAYAGWNPVGAKLIADVHGRYFLPLAPLLMLAIPARRPLPAHAAAWIAGFCTLCLGLALFAVVRRYYLL